MEKWFRDLDKEFGGVEVRGLDLAVWTEEWGKDGKSRRVLCERLRGVWKGLQRLRLCSTGWMEPGDVADTLNAVDGRAMEELQLTLVQSKEEGANVEAVPAALLELLRRCSPTLKSLHLTVENVSIPLSMGTPRILQNLTSLSLFSVAIPQGLLAGLALYLPSNTLEHFALSSMVLENDQMNDGSSFLGSELSALVTQQSRSLRHLTVACFPLYFTDEAKSCPQLGNALAGCPLLESLVLMGGVRDEDATIALLAPVLPQLKRCLFATRYEPFAAFGAVQAMPQLESLVIPLCKRMSKSEWDGMMRATNLKHLCIDGDNSAVADFSTFDLPNLESFDLMLEISIADLAGLLERCRQSMERLRHFGVRLRFPLRAPGDHAELVLPPLPASIVSLAIGVDNIDALTEVLRAFSLSKLECLYFACRGDHGRRRADGTFESKDPKPFENEASTLSLLEQIQRCHSLQEIRVDAVRFPEIQQAVLMFAGERPLQRLLMTACSPAFARLPLHPQTGYVNLSLGLHSGYLLFCAIHAELGAPLRSLLDSVLSFTLIPPFSQEPKPKETKPRADDDNDDDDDDDASSDDASVLKLSFGILEGLVRFTVNKKEAGDRAIFEKEVAALHALASREVAFKRVILELGMMLRRARIPLDIRRLLYRMFERFLFGNRNRIRL